MRVKVPHHEEHQLSIEVVLEGVIGTVQVALAEAVDEEGPDGYVQELDDIGLWTEVTGHQTRSRARQRLHRITDKAERACLTREVINIVFTDEIVVSFSVNNVLDNFSRKDPRDSAR